MATRSLSEYKSFLRIFIPISLVLGLLLLQAMLWTGASAQQPTITPEPTETTFKIPSQNNYCGSDLAKLYLDLQFRVINATKAVKGTLCGRLVLIKDYKTGVDYLGLVPCNRGGVYILKQRPKELLNYYQFVDTKFGKGKTVYSKEFGEITQYITKFQTYYPLDQCSSCGNLPGAGPVKPPEFAFPTPSPVSGLGGFLTPIPAPTTSTPQLLAQALNPRRSIPTLAPTATDAPTLTATPTPAASPENSQLDVMDLESKPPTRQPLDRIMSYGPYTFVLVPLLFLVLLWKRTR
jgi:hypothetical protein